MDSTALQRVERSIADLPFSMVVSDPRLTDCPITYVNEAFERATLYSREMAIGRNCRFLQGERTDADTVERIRTGLASGEDFSVDVLNYRADGSTFLNRLLISPLFSEARELVGYLGIQQVIREAGREAVPRSDTPYEVQHRVRNHLAMLVSLVRLQSSRAVTPESFQSLARRIESLSLLYDELSGRGVGTHDLESVPAGAYLSRVAAVLTALEAREAIRINIDCEEVTLPTETAARLGLILSELITNALKHAFVSQPMGLVEIRLTRLSGDGLRLTVSDDGCGMPPGSRWPEEDEVLEAGEGDAAPARADPARSGATIVRTMVESLDGQISVVSASRGTLCTLDIGF